MVLIRNALVKEVEEVFDLIERGVNEGSILKRTKTEISSLIRNELVFVAEDNSKLVGIVILDYYSKRLSELRSMYVMAEYRNSGVGKLLVNALLKKAEQLKIKEVMTITLKEMAPWFEKSGFSEEVHGFKVALFKKL